MNEILEKFAGEAFQFSVDNLDDTEKGSLSVFAEKFAELIVLECARKVEHIMRSRVQGDDTYGDAIREHFGVTE